MHPRLPRSLGGLLRRAGFRVTEQRVGHHLHSINRYLSLETVA
ncbi:hypothetical protein [Pseudonocardia alaniniphila]|nr:hypothetical protein [Pseudonocardia alaniniphila]